MNRSTFLIIFWRPSMKKNSLFLLGLLILLITACNPSGEEEADDALPTLVATAVNIDSNTTAVDANSTSTDISTADTNPIVIDNEEAASEPDDGAEMTDGEATLVNLDNILLYNEPPNSSYLTTLEYYMTVENDDGSTSQVGRLDASGSHTVSPNASSMVFNMDGGAGSGFGETMTVVQIEDTFYALLPPNSCLTLAAESGFENPFALFLGADNFLGNDVQRVLPNQMINGVESRHYILNEGNFTDLSLYDEIYDADLFIAEGGGYVTRLLITGFGVNEVVSGNSAQQGDIYYELNNIPQDTVPAITPPAECGLDSTIASEYPTLPDATGILSNEGVYAYETQTPFDEVVQFYMTEMIKDDEWALIQEVVQTPSASLTFSGVGGIVIIGIGPGQNGGTQVGIITTP